ncbi:MAG: carbamate kinase [Pseudonocardia sp.]|nr:carbamate kinase [Pseudonocardia sp.]
MAKVAVVALGGNAIIRSGQTGTFAEQWSNAIAMVTAVCRLRAYGWTVVVVHGNGPQIGNLAVQQEAGTRQVPELPLFMLGAMTEGQVGSLLSLAMWSACGDKLPGVVSVVTHVVVDEADPAFGAPTKPIGPFLSEAEARRQAADRGWVVGQDAGRGFRRLVASPKPVRIVELDAVRSLVDRGFMVVAAGGGGVPVVPADVGYRGVEAVIDKDFAAQRLATSLGAEALALVTDVPRVMLDFGTQSARPISEISVAQARAYEAEGHFPPGSMGPKMRAAIQFLDEGGGVSVITNADRLCASLGADTSSGVEDSGTRVVAVAEDQLGGPS